LFGGATTEGGNVFAWAQGALRTPEPGALEAALAAGSPDAHGLTVLPTLAGERSPGYAEDIRGTLHGISLSTTPVDMVRALIESISMRLASIGADLRASGIAYADAALVASGGALEASPTWCQIIADAAGVPLLLADVPEATSRGAALISGWAAGDVFDPQPPVRGRTFEPDLRAHARYTAAAERQRWLYARVVQQ
jgi:gluconokinase